MTTTEAVLLIARAAALPIGCILAALVVCAVADFMGIEP